jgi:hypothetical protein
LKTLIIVFCSNCCQDLHSAEFSGKQRGKISSRRRAWV